MPGMALRAVACGEVGSAVVGVDVEGSLGACSRVPFGAEAGRCRDLEGMGCRVDYEPVRSATPREVVGSLGVQRLSSSCVGGGGGHLLIVEAVKVLLVDLTREEAVLLEECRWPRAQLQMWPEEYALPQDA